MQKNPMQILLKREELTFQNIKHFYIAVEREEWKLDTFCDLYETLTITQAIVYCNTRRKVEWLMERMLERDFEISVMHGGMTQEERDLIMRDYRSGSTRLLITTDFLARGIDMQQVSFFLNYDLPTNSETYMSRIGRRAAYRRKVINISFLTAGDVDFLQYIERFYNIQIGEMPMDVADLI